MRPGTQQQPQAARALPDQRAEQPAGQARGIGGLIQGIDEHGQGTGAAPAQALDEFCGGVRAQARRGGDPVAYLAGRHGAGVDHFGDRAVGDGEPGRQPAAGDAGGLVGVGQGGEQPEQRGLARPGMAGHHRRAGGGRVAQPPAQAGQGGVAAGEPPGRGQEPIPQLIGALLGVPGAFLVQQIDIDQRRPVPRVQDERRLIASHSDLVPHRRLRFRPFPVGFHGADQRPHAQCPRRVTGCGQRPSRPVQAVRERPGQRLLVGSRRCHEHDAAAL